MKYIVDRRAWYRGLGSDDSALLRADGRRCCIGFVGQQRGLSDAELLGKETVLATKVLSGWPDWMLRGYDSKLVYTTSVHRAYTVNDDARLTDEERETLLKEIFIANGDEIEFIN